MNCLTYSQHIKRIKRFPYTLKLKPCPKCKSKDVYYFPFYTIQNRRKMAAIICNGCEYRIYEFKSKIIKKWCKC